MMHLVTLRIGRQIYALPLEPIAQIVELVTITPIPQSSPLVEGVIDVRGHAIPVVDLGRQLLHDVTPRDLHTPIVLLQSGERTLAVLVDEVLDVLAVTPCDLVNPCDVLPAGVAASPVLLGLARTGHGLVPVLNSEHLCEASALHELTPQIGTLLSEAPQVEPTQGAPLVVAREEPA